MRKKGAWGTVGKGKTLEGLFFAAEGGAGLLFAWTRLVFFSFFFFRHFGEKKKKKTLRRRGGGGFKRRPMPPMSIPVS
jgi:hypothetical protein